MGHELKSILANFILAIVVTLILSFTLYHFVARINAEKQQVLAQKQGLEQQINTIAQFEKEHANTLITQKDLASYNQFNDVKWAWSAKNDHQVSVLSAQRQNILIRKDLEEQKSEALTELISLQDIFWNRPINYIFGLITGALGIFLTKVISNLADTTYSYLIRVSKGI